MGQMDRLHYDDIPIKESGKNIQKELPSEWAKRIIEEGKKGDDR